MSNFTNNDINTTSRSTNDGKYENTPVGGTLTDYNNNAGSGYGPTSNECKTHPFPTNNDIKFISST